MAIQCEDREEKLNIYTVNMKVSRVQTYVGTIVIETQQDTSFTLSV